MGATVRAAADGTIAHVGVNPGGYGNYIVIKHERKDKPGQYYTTLYAHLSKMYFSSGSVGSKVTKDTPIGEVGNTGASTGAHLHFEMREGTGWGVTGGAVINPICSEIQALCGDTKVNPMQCTLECQQNPNSEACKTPFNLTFNWVQDMPKTLGNRFLWLRHRLSNRMPIILDNQPENVILTLTAILSAAAFSAICSEFCLIRPVILQKSLSFFIRRND